MVKKFDSFMLSIDFVRSKYDSCVYLHQLTNESFIYLQLYVDDMLIATKDHFEINHLKDIRSS